MRIGLWSVLCLSLFAWAPATYPGYWQGLEGYVPVFNAVQPDAIARVATAPDLWRGMGSATFLLTQPLLLLGISPLAAVQTLFALCFILGGLGIYTWLQPRLGDRTAGLAGLLYMFLPPFLATVYVRGSLSDALVMALFPFTLAGITAYSDSRSPSAAGVTVLGLLWIWRTQAGLAVFVTLLLLAYVLVVERDWLLLLIVTVSGAAGLVSLIPFWSIETSAPVEFSEHFVYLFQLFSTQWQIAPSIPGWQDGYPFQLGFAVLGFGTIAIWLWLTNLRQPQIAPFLGRLLGFATIGSLILLVLSLEPSRILWSWSGAERLLTYPWQIILVASPLLAMIAGSLPSLNREFGTSSLWVVLVSLAVLSSYPYLTTDFTQIVPSTEPVAILGANHEYILLDAQLTENKDTPEAILEITWQTLRSPSFDYNVFFQALKPEGETLTLVAQLDTQPLNGERPATTWQPGEILIDRYRLDLTEVPDRSGLNYYFGYYDWRDGARLPVDGGVDDKVVFYGER